MTWSSTFKTTSSADGACGYQVAFPTRRRNQRPVDTSIDVVVADPTTNSHSPFPLKEMDSPPDILSTTVSRTRVAVT